MAGPNAPWLRRHRRAVLITLAGGVLVGGGFGLWKGVEHVRSAALKSADL
ncbi:MAG TPA: hypothetical protein VH092_33690 [Urbifossiella sp.]|jgi:hypothetical protein|nr:hypothetical protein [Urbifossiella sp.]